MTETIKIIYSPVINVPTLGTGHHMTLVYTDSQGRNFSASSGPTVNPAQTVSNVIEAAAAARYNKPSPYEYLTASDNNGSQFTPGQNGETITRDANGNPYLSNVVATGDNLSSRWNTILDTYDRVASLHLPYSPLTQNSNSMAGTALAKAGIPLVGFLPSILDFPRVPGMFIPLPTSPSEVGNPSAPFGKAHPSPFQKRDPLVVDMDGNGVELSSVHNSTAHFDYGGAGFAPKTGWVAGETACSFATSTTIPRSRRMSYLAR